MLVKNAISPSKSLSDLEIIQTNQVMLSRIERKN